MTTANEPATPPYTPETLESDDLVDIEEGWSLMNYIVFIGFVCAFGALLWFLGGNRLIQRFATGRNGNAKYKRIDAEDLEKQRD